MTVKQFDENSHDYELDYWRAVLRRRPPAWMSSWRQNALLMCWMFALVHGPKNAPDPHELMPEFEYE